jgi:hypothetical protein
MQHAPTGPTGFHLPRRVRERLPRLVSAMSALLRTFLLLVGLTMVALVTPLLIGVWLPDVFTHAVHTLAERRLSSGHVFRVVQYWNGVDFYSTELRVTAPDGKTEVYLLDADDQKSWRLPLVIDEQGRGAIVILGGNRARTVEWR